MSKIMAITGTYTHESTYWRGIVHHYAIRTTSGTKVCLVAGFYSNEVLLSGSERAIPENLCLLIFIICE
ncbi:hypothetical protein DPMN_068330 [Dreissena polymorpha]|uniref:Uncharacterized protein n=1 Tax=Dreissena polymorpha TaxID=45954 RepID=A0A9D4BM46_DREPO|nr:hypothetical protein DPMN_068330 [Dreissena polymorpha]